MLRVLQLSEERSTSSTASSTPDRYASAYRRDAGVIYLDANATTPPLPTVVDAVSHAMRSIVGNPASAHASGASARRAIEQVRDDVAELVGVPMPESVFFVSGGTEANNTVISSFVRQYPSVTFLVAPVEHSSIIEPLLNWCPDRISWLAVDSCGRIDPHSAQQKAPQAGGPVVALLQGANSETGVIQPVAEIAEAIRSVRQDAFIHLDAAQAVGRIRTDGWSSSVDSISFSGHKIHGPHGTGALVVNEHTSLRPFILGGGQEHGFRSGTPNVSGIVGLGIAARERIKSFEEANGHMLKLRTKFEEAVTCALGQSVRINGAEALRVSNTSNLQFCSIDGMQLLAHLDAAGVMASQGSACSSGRPEPSRVLRAMGLSEGQAFSSLRFSFSVLNTEEDAVVAADIIASVVKRLTQ